MDYWVYILYSSPLDRFYKGQTSDIDQRIYRHNHGHEKSTKSGSPWLLVWKTSKSSRREALLLEAKLKHLSRERLLDFMFKYNQDIEKDQIDVLRRLRFEP